MGASIAKDVKMFWQAIKFIFCWLKMKYSLNGKIFQEEDMNSLYSISLGGVLY
jgi:hypothetical protein